MSPLPVKLTEPAVPPVPAAPPALPPPLLAELTETVKLFEPLCVPPV